MPRKKTTGAKRERNSAAAKPNKSAFVRSLPPDTPAREVIEKAKAQGMKLTPAYIYSIRTAAKAGVAKRRTGGIGARGGRRARGTAARAASPSNARIEDLLRAVAAELGLSRAIGLLQQEQQKVRAVLGG